MGILVGAYVEDARVLLEDMLGAVTVVQIPVHDEHTFHGQTISGIMGADGRIVEEAKPLRPPGLGVMTRRARQDQGVLHLAGDNRIDARQDTAGRKAGHLV